MIIPIFLQLAALAIAAAIQEPLPTFDPFCGTPAPVFDNSTRTTNWADYIQDVKARTGGPIPWPRNSDGKVVIPYCFVAEWDRKNIRNVVENSMGKWLKYPGGDASEISGHVISFQERKASYGKPMYCAHPKYRNYWDENTPHDTVAFEYTEGRGWGGAVALTQNGKPWQQLVHIADRYTLLGALHKLGHILGMAHQHSRADRDTYVHIDYKQVADWDDCWKRAQDAEPDITPEGVCHDISKAIKYSCSCAAFIKNVVEPGLAIHSFGRYDLSSIMYYLSKTGYSEPDCVNNGKDCPLYVYVDTDDHGEGVTLLEQVRRPSELDILWVKMTCPWKWRRSHS